MKKRRIFSDLDMTLCDTIYPVRQMVKEEHGIHYDISDFKSYGFLEEQLGPKAREFWCRPELYEKVPLYPYAQWFIECLRELGEVHIITYSVGYDIRKHKDEFIDKRFKGIADIHHAREKHEILTPDDIIIDDYLVNIQGHIHHNGGDAILFNHDGENPWAKYHPKTALTDKHHYAESYKAIIQKLKGIL